MSDAHDDEDLGARSAAYYEELQKGFRGLGFARPVESQFREEFAQQHLARVRMGFGVALVLYAAFMLLRLPAEAGMPGAWVLKLRLVGIAAMVVTVGASYWPRLRGLMPILSGATYAVFAATVTAIVPLEHRNGVEPHYESLILVSFHVYVFSGLLFRPALAAGVFIFLAYLLGGAAGGLAGREWAYQLLFIALANVIGATALYAIERIERDSFLRRHLLLLYATRDALTGLYNRAAFFGQLDRTVRQASRTGATIAIALLDIDHFKAYNDRYGHLEGDACLRAVAGAIRESFRRPMDAVGRYGGEEFVGVWHDVPGRSVRDLAETLRASVQALKIAHASAPSGRVTTSVGAVVLVPQEGESLHALMQRADKALYAAKDKGRNRVVVEVLPSALNAPQPGVRRAPTVSAG